MSHTQGKLQFAHRRNQEGYSTELFDETGETVAVAAWYPIKTETGYATNREENARRLVACWNALDGVPTEWLENYVAGDIKNILQENAALKADLLVAKENWENAHADLIRKEAHIAALKAENEQLRKDNLRLQDAINITWQEKK